MIFVGTVFWIPVPISFRLAACTIEPPASGAMGYLSRIASRSKGVAVFFMNQFGTGSAFHGHCINLECTLYDKKNKLPRKLLVSSHCW